MTFDMRNLPLLLFLTLLPFCLPAQYERPRLIAGLETSGAIIHYANRTGISPQLEWALRFNPYIMARLGRHWYAGAGYARDLGNVGGVPLPVLNSAGLHLRGYIPTRFRDEWLQDRFRFYGAASWYLADFQADRQTGVTLLDGFRNHQIGLRAGGQFRLFSGLYLETAYNLNFFTKGDPFFSFQTWSLEYHFGEKRPPLSPPPPPDPDRKNAKFKLYDPEGFFKKVTIGASYTFIFDDQNTDDLFNYQEHTLNLNAAVAIGADLDLGAAWLGITAREKGQPAQQYSLAGGFLQYNLLRGMPGIRLFLETGFYRGNFCTCGEGTPYRRPNLSYIPYGGGLEGRLFKSRHWYIDLSFLWYQPVTRLPGENPYAFSQYVLGVNYRFRP